MAQWVKPLWGPDDPGLIPSTHAKVERENQLHKVILRPSYTYLGHEYTWTRNQDSLIKKMALGQTEQVPCISTLRGSVCSHQAHHTEGN